MYGLEEVSGIGKGVTVVKGCTIGIPVGETELFL